MSSSPTDSQDMSRFKELAVDEIALIQEEERLLSQLQRAIRTETTSSRLTSAELERRFNESRDAILELSGSGSYDMPSLLEDMQRQQSLADRTRPVKAPPEASPYFARLQLVEGKKRRDVLLSYSSFISSKLNFSVVDWRNAPLAQVFFRFREGDEFEQELPSRLATGTVAKRHIVSIQGGVLVRLQTGSSCYECIDGLWQKQTGRVVTLKGGAGAAMRTPFGTGESRRARADITSLLDPDQYQALLEDPEHPLLVLGAAGSGKTTVALHRLASLNYQNPRRFHAKAMSVVVPELGVARLHRNLLAMLGGMAARVETFDEWVERVGIGLLRQEGAQKVRLTQATPARVVAFKRHPTVTRLIADYLDRLAKQPETKRRLPSLREDHSALFADEALLTRAVIRSDGDLRVSDIAIVCKHTREQHRDRLDLSTDDIESIDGVEIDEDSANELAGTYDLEDMAILLELQRQKIKRFPQHRLARTQARRLEHLLLDEAQELADVELSALGDALAGQSLTVAGDEAQLTSSAVERSWDAFFACLRVQSPTVSRFTTNYRSTRAIAELGDQVLGPMAPKRQDSPREGAAIKRSHYTQFSVAMIEMIQELEDLLTAEPKASLAVICRREDRARLVHRALADKIAARLVTEGDFSFRPGIDVTTIDQVKGLEFDYVVVADCDASTYGEDRASRRALYVAVTRAVHQLWLVCATGGSWSPLVELSP